MWEVTLIICHHHRSTETDRLQTVTQGLSRNDHDHLRRKDMREDDDHEPDLIDLCSQQEILIMMGHDAVQVTRESWIPEYMHGRRDTSHDTQGDVREGRLTELKSSS